MTDWYLVEASIFRLLLLLKCCMFTKYTTVQTFRAINIYDFFFKEFLNKEILFIQNTLPSKSLGPLLFFFYLFFKRNFIKQGCIILSKSDSKDIYNVTKWFYFK